MIDPSDRRSRGRVVVVTGGTRGIGRAIALHFSREGARLILNHLGDATAAAEAATACREAGGDVVVVPGNVADSGTAERICQTALDSFGALDVLVNNAGVSHDGLVATLPDAELEAMVSTNVIGVVRLARAALRPMIERRSGCIINISSVAARKPSRGNAVYAGTKGFVESFTAALAAEVGRKGIRVNAIAPGVVSTEMTSGIVKLAGETIESRVALRRLGRPGDVSAVAVFLASEEAAYISGAVFPVDGGYGVP